MAKILLVEDNEMNQDMLSRRLIKRGFGKAIAVDGQQGLDMAGSENTDLGLLDVSLPVMDGWEVAGNLGADDGLKDIPHRDRHRHDKPPTPRHRQNQPRGSAWLPGQNPL